MTTPSLEQLKTATSAVHGAVYIQSEDRLFVSIVFVVRIGTPVDLSEFNKGQIMMACYFGTSNLRNGTHC